MKDIKDTLSQMEADLALESARKFLHGDKENNGYRAACASFKKICDQLIENIEALGLQVGFDNVSDKTKSSIGTNLFLYEISCKTVAEMERAREMKGGENESRGSH